MMLICHQKLNVMVHLLAVEKEKGLRERYLVCFVDILRHRPLERGAPSKSIKRGESQEVAPVTAPVTYSQDSSFKTSTHEGRFVDTVHTAYVYNRQICRG
jgi:hypothetical protein